MVTLPHKVTPISAIPYTYVLMTTCTLSKTESVPCEYVRRISCLDTNTSKTLSYQNITFHLIVKPIHDTHILLTTSTLSKTMFTILLIIVFTLGYVYANVTHNDTSRTFTNHYDYLTNYYNHCKNIHQIIHADAETYILLYLSYGLHRSCHAQVCFTKI